MNEADQDQVSPDTIGQRLKAAREAKGMSLDDVAKTTRIPIRHLQHIENGEWDALPAVTYSVGFARAYANAIGLDGAEIGVELRAQLGSGRVKYATVPAYYEPADPARVPPRSLAIVAALIALALVIGFFVWRSGAVDDTGVDTAEIAAADSAAAPQGPPPASDQPLGGPSAVAGATGPVVLTASNDVWLRVYEGGGGAKLFENILKAGERYEVPASARQPQILTGRPNALSVSVGTTPIPQLGPAERTIADVSLLPADLLARVGPTPAPAPAQ